MGVPVIEIFPDGQWIDITHDHRAEAGTSQSRGRQRLTDTTSTNLSMVLDNTGGKYSSDVPGTPYYRKLGRGTPIRVTEPLVRDLFGRTTSNGWGSTPAFVGDKPNPVLAWSNGIGPAADYATTGTTARHTCSATNSARQSRLDVRYSVVELTASVAIGATATGATARASIVFRKDDNGTSYYRAELAFDTAGNVSLALIRIGGLGNVTLDSVAAGTYTPGAKWWIKTLAVGTSLCAKAWPNGSVEPAGWTLDATDTHWLKGQIALRSFRDTGNTNSNLTFDWDDFVISMPDFFGEIWSMRPVAAEGGHDLTMTIAASGLLRRLSNTQKSLRSAMYRSMLQGLIFGQPPVAYWPMEDGKLAERLEQVMPGALDGFVDAGTKFAVDSTLPGSAALVETIAGGHLHGLVPTFPAGFDAAVDEWAITFVARIDAKAPAAGNSTIFRFHTYGATSAYEASLDQAGNITFRGLNPDMFALAAPYVWSVTGLFDLANQGLGEETFYGQWMAFSVTNNASGSGQIRLQWQPAIGADIQGHLETATGAPHREPRGPWRLHGSIDGARAFGHLAIWSTPEQYLNSPNVASGWAGEGPGRRLERLTGEEGIAFLYDGRLGAIGEANSADGMVRLGPQSQGTLIDNLEDAADAGMGILAEPRHQLGVFYRGIQGLYNQQPVAVFNASAKTLAAGLDPVRDDASGLANEVVATRPGGTAQTITIPDGDVFHLTTEDVPVGIGLVQASASPNVLADTDTRATGGWSLHQRAWREPRFEKVEAWLHSPAYTGDAQLAADVRSVGEGDLIRITNIPPLIRPTLPPGDIDLLVQGISRFRNGIVDKVVFNCTPGVPWEAWQVNTSGSVIVVPIDSDDTLVRASTSVGPEWVTSYDLPVGWQIDGEAMAMTSSSTDTPAFIAAGTVATGNNASVVPGLPAGMTADVGQSLYLHAAIRNSGTGVPDTPAGWTTVVNNGNMKVFHRYYQTGDTAPTVTFTGGVANADTMARIYGFSGVGNTIGGAFHPRLSLYRTPGTADSLNASTQNIAYPAYYMHGRQKCVVMIFAWKQDDWTGVAPPAGFTEMGDNSTTTGDDAGLAAYYQIQPFGTATNTAAGTLVVTGGASAISRASVVAFRPLQQFAVVRSVNGVVASHSAGAEINVWRHGAIPL